MKAKKLQWLLAMALLSVTFSLNGCSKDDPSGDDGDDDGGGTEVETNTTATTEVKEAVVKLSYFPYAASNISYDPDQKYFNNIWIYEDYLYKYSFVLATNNLYLAPFKRTSSTFQCAMTYGRYSEFAKLELVESSSSILSVTQKNELISWTDIMYAEVQPHKGYMGVFRTQNDGDKNIRVFIKDYKLDKDSRLESITIQYQLY